MDTRIENYLKKKTPHGRGPGTRYPTPLKREAVELWDQLLSTGVGPAQAARALEHEVKTLRRWSELYPIDRSVLAPVVLREGAEPAPPSSVEHGSAGTSGGHIAIQSPDGWSFAVESAVDAVTLVRGLR